MITVGPDGITYEFYQRIHQVSENSSTTLKLKSLLNLFNKTSITLRLDSPQKKQNKWLVCTQESVQYP